MKINKTNIKYPLYDLNRKTMRPIKHQILYFLILCLTSCTTFVEVEPPKNTLVSETVFEDPATVASALANIYYKMREQGMVSGNFGLGISMGVYSDELDYLGMSTGQLNLYNHNISANDATTVLGWWDHAYNLIYAANDVIKGIDNSTGLSLEAQEQFKGQALFIRGYLYSLLVGLYGDIPYITTTNYIENNTVTRMPEHTVYEHVIADLGHAVELLNDSDTTGEHVIPNKAVAEALLARIYLYTENWDMAATISDAVISNHDLEWDINKVFLKNSKETLWQFKPGPDIKNTLEAGWLIIAFIPTQGYALSNGLLSAFELNDSRRSNWVSSITSTDGLTTLYYAHKYKETINTATTSLEYTIVFRLTEQYLIRAEARANLGNIIGAQADLNTIRNRAGLENTAAATKMDLLDAIFQERRVELFTEQGHRWFDLKRSGEANDVLSAIKPNWSPTDLLLPIPETELEINTNLKPQNPGY